MAKRHFPSFACEARKIPTQPTRRQQERRGGTAFARGQKTTIEQVMNMLRRLSPEMGKWLVVHLALLTVATLQLWRGARSGNGRLTLCALSRALPLDEPEKARSKRL